MESHYSINIARHTNRGVHPYEHYCRIELSPGMPESEAINMLADTRQRYRLPEFVVTMTRWEVMGFTVPRSEA